jgi:hypothetical protein
MANVHELKEELLMKTDIVQRIEKLLQIKGISNSLLSNICFALRTLAKNCNDHLIMPVSYSLK